MNAIIHQAMMPAAEADDVDLERRIGHLATALGPFAKAQALDWVQVERLIRSAVGWDDRYPGFPDFPEWRTQP